MQLRNGQAADAREWKLPIPMSLPVNERRRASQVVRLALDCAEQALQGSPFAVNTLRLVFASDEGTGEVCQQMLEALAIGRDISPLLFHNSVHNAPSGYFSIGHQNQQAAVSVSLGRESFASGLLCAVTEARATGQPVLFVAYDAPVPAPLFAVLPISQPSATAWIIAAAAPAIDGKAALASFVLHVEPAGGAFEDDLPAWLPRSWAGNSSALGFVALALLAERNSACEFRLGDLRLRLERSSERRSC